ncbi:MAG: tetratricopeptide repeat protein [Bacteroidia bacterium]|nr:tetratricopeptide repeat protein [Bacteroidia bacterium]MDW8159118.1 tetratricopeptide repeat protein [Bacteroidia bacterium]
MFNRILLYLVGGACFYLLISFKAQDSLLKYQKLLSKFPESENQILFNIAQSYLLQDSLDKAQEIYKNIINRLPSVYKSIVHTNWGYIEAIRKNEEVALSYFRKALLENPQNNIARFNYELLLRRRKKNPTSLPYSTSVQTTGIVGFSSPIPTENSDVVLSPTSLEQTIVFYEKMKTYFLFSQQLKRNIKSKTESKINNW